MTTLFYDHLIGIGEITEILDREGIPPEEQKEIMEIIDATIHQEILDLILTHLPKENHETFLSDFHRAPTDPKLLAYLEGKITIDIKHAIKEHAEKIKAGVRDEIENAKK